MPPQVLLEAPADVSIRDAIGDLDAMRDAMARVEINQQLQPSAFQRRAINADCAGRRGQRDEWRRYAMSSAGGDPDRAW